MSYAIRTPTPCLDIAKNTTRNSAVETLSTNVANARVAINVCDARHLYAIRSFSYSN